MENNNTGYEACHTALKTLMMLSGAVLVLAILSVNLANDHSRD
jgi:hypothetical protein